MFHSNSPVEFVPSSCAQEARKSDIQIQMSELMQEISKLGELISITENNLIPVLHQGPSCEREDCDKMKESAPATPLGTLIREARVAVIGYSTRIASLINNLEL